jgi:hypothetical protein
MDSSSCIQQLRTILGREVLVQDGLNRYERYIAQIEANKHTEPNVAFEATKSLGEAIFRHILSHPSIKAEHADMVKKGDAATVGLFKNVCVALSDHDLLDIEIMNPGKKFFHEIAEIRNSTGLISHGKDLRQLTNLKASTIELAIANMVNHILVILEAYELLLGEPEPSYENSAEFNEYLDEENEIAGISYSQALYDQDLVAYKERLDEYNEFKQEEDDT